MVCCSFEKNGCLLYSTLNIILHHHKMCSLYCHKCIYCSFTAFISILLPVCWPILSPFSPLLSNLTLFLNLLCFLGLQRCRHVVWHFHTSTWALCINARACLASLQQSLNSTQCPKNTQSSTTGETLTNSSRALFRGFLFNSSWESCPLRTGASVSRLEPKGARGHY